MLPIGFSGNIRILLSSLLISIPLRVSSATDIETETQTQDWLPWSLVQVWPDMQWHTDSICAVTEIAKTLEGAKQYMQNSAGYWHPISMREESTKISFVYFDGLLKVKSNRIFYKDMDTCKKDAESLPNKK